MFLKIGVLVIPAVTLAMHVVVDFLNFFFCYFKKITECLNTSWQTQIKNMDLWLNSSSSTNESTEKEMTHIFVWAFLSYDWSKNR